MKNILVIAIAFFSIGLLLSCGATKKADIYTSVPKDVKPIGNVDTINYLGTEKDMKGEYHKQSFSWPASSGTSAKTNSASTNISSGNTGLDKWGALSNEEIQMLRELEKLGLISSNGGDEDLYDFILALMRMPRGVSSGAFGSTIIVPRSSFDEGKSNLNDSHKKVAKITGYVLSHSKFAGFYFIYGNTNNKWTTVDKVIGNDDLSMLRAEGFGKLVFAEGADPAKFQLSSAGITKQFGDNSAQGLKKDKMIQIGWNISKGDK